jgi:hypothetical protein
VELARPWPAVRLAEAAVRKSPAARVAQAAPREPPAHLVRRTSAEMVVKMP